MIDGIEIVHVVAFDKNLAIGKNNKLAWHIPEDLQHFKQLTYNGIVIMGRKTFESIGKALPHRENIVISGNVFWEAPNALRFGRIDSAIAYAAGLAKNQNRKSIFVIGGSEIYRQTLNITDRIEATQVNTIVDEADAFYPEFSSLFKLSSNQPDIGHDSRISHKFLKYERI